jgi:hypothetical protein
MSLGCEESTKREKQKRLHVINARSVPGILRILNRCEPRIARLNDLGNCKPSLCCGLISNENAALTAEGHSVQANATFNVADRVIPPAAE